MSKEKIIKKKTIYHSYFGKNIPRIIFLISCVRLCEGALNIFVGNPYGGTWILITGIIPFFFTVHRQVSNKHIDDLVDKTRLSYIDQNIKGRMIGKRELNPSDFSVFSGFIRDGGDVRFKSCRDGKVRTSKYYVTAISVSKTECIVSTTYYNLLTEDPPAEELLYIKASESIRFTKNETQFPKGNFECVLKTANLSDNKELHFYLPANDYLAEQYFEKIAALQNN